MNRSFNRLTVRTLGLAVVAAVLGTSSLANAATPEPVKSDSGELPKIDLAIYPPEISLTTAADFQSFVAVLRRDDGVTEDITEQVRWSVVNDKLAKIDGHLLRPVADGETTLRGRFSGTTVDVKVTVAKAGTHPPVSFIKDVMPTLTRAGCNTGSCHGAARGKDGFNLSLFGFDPNGDYQRITREIGVRRINLAVPSESLLLKKSVGSVPHTGGKLFDVDSDYYETMHSWLEAGAPKDAADALPPAVTSVAIYPPQVVLEGEGAKQRMVAVATYADGTTRDLSRLATFSTNDASVAPIDQDGVATAGSRGEAFVMARFDTHTVGSQVLTLPADLKYIAPEPQPSSYVDELVDKKLNQLRLVPSGQCTDEEFIRRATIDITGLLPTEEELNLFVNDVAPDKREALIDRLLERKEFSEIWAMKFAQLLMIKSTNQVSKKSALLYANWLTDQFARNVPINEMVHDLLTSTGGTFGEPATNFYEIERDTLKTAENVAQVFMGIRTQCAQCHNHPFDRWTMDDYYGFAAFFSQVGRKQAEDYREKIVYNRFSGETKHLVTKQNVPPKFLGGDAPDTKGKDRREVLAEWLVAGDNPFFSTSIANRVWAHFMGSGLVDPVDDIRVSNPPSNPELFDRLGEKLVEYNYDFRKLVRDICTSRAYGRSTKTNDSNAHDTRNYAHATIRRVPAESLLDCICQVTESPEKFSGLPLGSRAVQISDGATSNYFLTTFGRSPRATVCECEATTDPSLSQALHLLNGSSVHNKIVRGGLIKRWINDEKLDPDAILDRIYRRALSRDPSAEEREAVKALLAEEGAQPQAVMEDVFWAVLNGREFVFNH
ncbi:DUF1549 and DUF1553 domain-containing protein [Rhodopirellula halodulae]|uniref:DUF1549 and DUF1553 domain-containing protein n=1 Tax=Rhodopirellula halodulae TaxID=2894198 RepID=UPI001E58CBA4|nr:DUF1549 and DUF1553 domain-containing protein [Rhodopirellula sp. JC737]MCC9658063.1 DUF1549 and DUF1553 domain-containing protein [Rhodopirellula sp. JC737]